MKINKQFFAKLFIALVVVQGLYQFDKTTTNAKSTFQKVDYSGGNFDPGMNPGMMIRFEQASFENLKMALQRFVPHYAEFDMKLPNEIEFDVGPGDVLWDAFLYHCHWTDITYENPILDIMGIQVSFNQIEDSEEQDISIDFPAFRSVSISAYQEIETWILPLTGWVFLGIYNFKVDVVFSLDVTQKGFLRPVFHHTSVDFGDTYFYFEDGFTEFLVWQVLEFSKIMIENSIFFLGSIVFTDMLEGIIDKYSHGYQQYFWLTSRIVSNDITYAQMNFDYRQVRKPYVGNGFIDFFMVGELEYTLDKKQGQFCDFAPEPMGFASQDDKQDNQVVISEKAAQCALNNYYRAPISYVQIDQDRINKMLSIWKIDKPFQFSTSSIAKDAQIGLFERKLGKNIHLAGEFKLKNFDVKFGRFDTDIILEYTLCFELSRRSKGAEPFFYDELHMITSGQVETSDDSRVYIEILSHKLDLTNKYHAAELPKKETIGINSNEYKEFLSSFNIFLNLQKNWFNKKLAKGFHLPWAKNEFSSNLKFKPGSAHVFVHIGEDLDHLLEEEFWDQETKDEKGIGHDKADWDWVDGELWEDKEAEDQMDVELKKCKNFYTRHKNYCVDKSGKDTPQINWPAGNESEDKCMKECNKIHDCTAIEWYKSEAHGPCLLTITNWGPQRVSGGSKEDQYKDAICFVRHKKCDVQREYLGCYNERPKRNRRRLAETKEEIEKDIDSEFDAGQSASGEVPQAAANDKTKDRQAKTDAAKKAVDDFNNNMQDEFFEKDEVEDIHDIEPKEFPHLINTKSEDKSPQDCFMRAKAMKYEYVGIMNGDECWAGMNQPVGEKLADSMCSAKCSYDDDEERKKQDEKGELTCGDDGRVSVYRITVPGQAPNEMARMVLDDTECQAKQKLDPSQHLWDCARQVRADTAKGGACAGGGGYFNWEAQSPAVGACSCCTSGFRNSFTGKSPAAAFVKNDDTNLYKIEHCQNTYKEYLNYCATEDNRDTEQIEEPRGHESLEACQSYCNLKPDCTAVEWYSGNKKEGDKKQNGYCLLTITEWGTANQATKGYEGERWMDATCHVRTRECDGNELSEGIFVAIDSFLEKYKKGHNHKS